MAISGSAQEANVLLFRYIQDTLEFSMALISAFSLLTITIPSQHVNKIQLTEAMEIYS